MNLGLQKYWLRKRIKKHNCKIMVFTQKNTQAPHRWQASVLSLKPMAEGGETELENMMNSLGNWAQVLLHGSSSENPMFYFDMLRYWRVLPITMYNIEDYRYRNTLPMMSLLAAARWIAWCTPYDVLRGHLISRRLLLFGTPTLISVNLWANVYKNSH